MGGGGVLTIYCLANDRTRVFQRRICNVSIPSFILQVDIDIVSGEREREAS